MSRTPLVNERLRRAKTAYTTRLVRREAMTSLVTGVAPRHGDLVLARVDVIGQHPRLERPDGRRAALHPGDEIVVCYGARYAPDQFEAEVPGDLGPCSLVAAGGLAGRVASRHGRMSEATALAPVGLLADDRGRRLNLRDWGLPARGPVHPRPPTVAVVGTAMNAGKTTAAASLVHGLSRSGVRAGAAKLTGTGTGGDLWCFVDAGAAMALDFTAAGHATTYRLPAPEVRRIAGTLTAELTAAGCEAVVLEVADGLFQAETADLVTSEAFREMVDGVVFAAGDALGAVAGVAQLQALGLPVLAVSGVLTASPLAVQEVRSVLDVPVWRRDELSDPVVAALVQGTPFPLALSA